MDENQKKVLDMLAEGKITADEAERLLNKLQGAGSRDRAPATAATPAARPAGEPQGSGDPPRFLRVVIESSDGDNVNVRVPMALIRAGIKMGALLPEQARVEMAKHGVDLSEISNMDPDELVEALTELTVDVDSSEGDTVRVFCE